MEIVNPIKTKRDIQRMKDYLMKQSYRDYFMFSLGINVGLRISDLLKFQVKDVRNKDLLEAKDRREQKTKKTWTFPLNGELQELIEKYTEGMDDEDYLFPSRKGKYSTITEDRAYIIIRDAGNALGIPHLGSHTLRKTFGYHHYQKFKDLAYLMDLFNHSSLKVTAKYIGLDEDYKREMQKDFYL